MTDSITVTFTGKCIAWGKTYVPGQVATVTRAQADHLRDAGVVAPYETKVLPPAEKKTKKQSQSSRPARASRKKTAKRRKKKATKR